MKTAQLTIIFFFKNDDKIDKDKKEPNIILYIIQLHGLLSFIINQTTRLYYLRLYQFLATDQL